MYMFSPVNKADINCKSILIYARWQSACKIEQINKNIHLLTCPISTYRYAMRMREIEVGRFRFQG